MGPTQVSPGPLHVIQPPALVDYATAVQPYEPTPAPPFYLQTSFLGITGGAVGAVLVATIFGLAIYFTRQNKVITLSLG